MDKTSRPLLLLLLPLTLAIAACSAAGAAAPAPAQPTAPVTVSTPVVAAPPAAEPRVPAIDRAALRATLSARRQVQIARLRAYRDAGVFPMNREQPGMLNVFIDDDGAICAAANLMWQDGHDALVRKTAAADNYLRLVTVTRGPLLDWMLTSGLTQAEIDRIQEPYSFIEEPGPSPQIALEVKRLQAHFDKVLFELERDSDKNLDAAVALLAGRPALIATL